MSNLQAQLDETIKAINTKKAAMRDNEISDDFYYTNGRRSQDIMELNQLEIKAEGIQKEIARGANDK